MINFILGLIHKIFGDINSAVKWMTGAIASVYSYFDRVWHMVESEAIAAWREAVTLFHEAWNFVLQVYNFARAIIDVWGRDLISWIRGIWDDVYGYAKAVYGLLVKWVDYLRNALEAGLHYVEQWVLKNVWEPLYNRVSGILHWITNEGAFVYYLLTHPDKLVALLSKWLWASYLDLLRRYGKVIGHWLVHSLRGLAGPFMTVLEDIISGML